MERLGTAAGSILDGNRDPRWAADPADGRDDRLVAIGECWNQHVELVFTGGHQIPCALIDRGNDASDADLELWIRQGRLAGDYLAGRRRRVGGTETCSVDLHVFAGLGR